MQNFSVLNKNFLLIFLFLILLFSCSSPEVDSGSDSGAGIIPTNLVITTEIVGQSLDKPDGDGSGIVKFNINATNATSFKISFGDGNTQDATSGINTYTYKTAGTYSYIVNVTAFDGSNSISSSITVKVSVSTAPIWSDEFDVAGAPNSTKWGYDIGAGAGGWGNNESQYYTNRPQNVIVENGLLKIIAKKESYQGSNYTSARILTKGKFSFKYGKVEIRAKLPSGGGTWPALWMLGNNIDSAIWPACGEIDIMEHKWNDPNKIFNTLHYPGHSGGSADGSTTVISNATTEFHIYSLDWRADTIRFYVDNRLFKTFLNNSSLPFNQKFFLIINTAMGGSFGGVIDPNFVSSAFEVDYIRVFN